MASSITGLPNRDFKSMSFTISGDFSGKRTVSIRITGATGTNGTEYTNLVVFAAYDLSGDNATEIMTSKGTVPFNDLVITTDTITINTPAIDDGNGVSLTIALYVWGGVDEATPAPGGSDPFHTGGPVTVSDLMIVREGDDDITIDGSLNGNMAKTLQKRTPTIFSWTRG